MCGSDPVTWTGGRGPVALMDLDLCCSVSLETEQNRTVDDDYISC